MSKKDNPGFVVHEFQKMDNNNTAFPFEDDVCLKMLLKMEAVFLLPPIAVCVKDL